MTGCAVGPGLFTSRPSDADRVSGWFRSGDPVLRQSALVGSVCQDEELRRLIRIALAENKDLQRAVASVEEFQSRLLISEDGFRPKADVAPMRCRSVARPTSCRDFQPFSNYYSKAIRPGNWHLGTVRRSNEAARGFCFAREEARCGGAATGERVAEAYLNCCSLTCSWGAAHLEVVKNRSDCRGPIASGNFTYRRRPAAERANVARAAELTRQMVQKGEPAQHPASGRPPGQAARAVFDGAGVAAGGASRSAVRIAPASARPGAG